MELLVPYDPDRGPGWYALWAAVADDRIATHEKHLAALLLYDATASRIGIVYRHENIGTLIQILRTMAPYFEADVDTGGILDMSHPRDGPRACGRSRERPCAPRSSTRSFWTRCRGRPAP